MSVAATMPHGQPGLPFDSTLVWARSAAFASPHALAAVIHKAPSSCPGPAAPVPTALLRPSVCRCDGCCSAVIGGGPCGAVENGNADGEVAAWRSQARLHASASCTAVDAGSVAAVYGGGASQSFPAPPAGLAVQTAQMIAGTRSKPSAGTELRGGAAEGIAGTAPASAVVNHAPAFVLPRQPASPHPPPKLLPNGPGNTSGRASGGGSGGASSAALRRPAYGVKASAMTSQITAAQRNRAATLIQAAWRGFRIRRLYLRLIVWRLRPPARQQHDTYCGIREFPPVPDLPDVSLFTQYGRPYRFRAVKRRVWFEMEGPFRSGDAPTAASRVPHQLQQEKPQSVKPQPAPAALLPPRPLQPQPAAHQPGPRVSLRLTVPPRAEADVPMSEVERILAGGFWRVDEPGVGGSVAGDSGAVGGGASGDGEEGLSLYMRAKMRQEEREAEEALQMLSYEPNDLMHKLGSLKERTLERLGSLGRTLGEALLGSRAHGHGQGYWPGHEQGHWPWHFHWPGAGSAHSAGGSGGGGGGNGGGVARSLPRAGRWGASGGVVRGGAPRPHASSARCMRSGALYCLAPGPSYPPPSGSGSGSGANAVGGGGAAAAAATSSEWSLRMPLLTVVDAEGRARMEVPAGAVAVPIAVNWQRYRSRSHVTRMSF